MPAPTTYDGDATYDDGSYYDDDETPEPPPPPMSNDNQISAAITEENITAFLGHLASAAALLPTLPELTDAQLRRLLGVDESTEIDDIAAEALAAHPEWKPVRVNIAEYAKDRTLLETTAPLAVPTASLGRKVTVLRRLASHDTRRATLAIYAVISDLAANGNIDAQAYYDRLFPFFDHAGPTPPAPTPPTP